MEYHCKCHDSQVSTRPGIHQGFCVVGVSVSALAQLLIRCPALIEYDTDGSGSLSAGGMGSAGGAQGCGGSVVQADKSSTAAISIAAQISRTARRLALRFNNVVRTPDGCRCCQSLVKQNLLYTGGLLCAVAP